MIDIVIPLRSGSKNDNFELRYALRSIEMHLKNVGKVYLVTDIAPKWINHQYVKTIYFPPETDNYRFLTRNIHQKIEHACRLSSLSDQFLYMNDDHFLLHNHDTINFPIYHMGPKWDVGKGKYKVTIQNTIDNLNPGYPTNTITNFDIHAPMIMNKALYLAYVSRLNWGRHFGYCIKTMYQYLTKLREQVMVYEHDLKISDSLTFVEINAILRGRKFFSTDDRALNIAMQNTLEILYSIKSKYEI